MNRIALAAFSAFALSLTLGLCTSARADTYTITLDPAARATPATGRVVLYIVTESAPRSVRFRRPLDGPFFESPQPIASIAVTDFKPGDTVVIDGSTPAFPASLDTLHGSIIVQAILDADTTVSSAVRAPGNVLSDPLKIEVNRDADDHIQLSLNRPATPRPMAPETERLKWVEFKSESLSAFYGRDIFHRAGVALPNDYLDPASEQSHWPAMYEIPGFGSRHQSAAQWAYALQHADPDLQPQAVWIVLDPECPFTHHSFADGPNNGPRATALVTEFIPYLEKTFRLVSKSEARLLFGHSSGGWSALWLQLHYPEIFGGCWSSAPDPIDFTHFQATNIYDQASMFVQPDGSETPSYNELVGLAEIGVMMTVRQEVAMEHAIDPTGRSAQQWDAWNAVFSPRDETTGMPQRLFNPATGEIDREIVKAWSHYDIARLVTSDWDRFSPIINEKVRIACGEFDSFYLNHAVEAFKQKVEATNNGPLSTGYIRIVKYGTHDNLHDLNFARFSREMIKHLYDRGLHAVAPGPEKPMGKPGRPRSPSAPSEPPPSAPNP